MYVTVGAQCGVDDRRLSRRKSDRGKVLLAGRRGEDRFASSSVKGNRAIRAELAAVGSLVCAVIRACASSETEAVRLPRTRGSECRTPDRQTRPPRATAAAGQRVEHVAPTGRGGRERHDLEVNDHRPLALAAVARYRKHLERQILQRPSATTTSRGVLGNTRIGVSTRSVSRRSAQETPRPPPQSGARVPAPVPRLR